MNKPYVTVLHGTCLLKGKHPIGSQEWRKCPLNPERLQKRSARAKKAAETRRRGLGGSVAGPGNPEVPPTR